jgi:hypothetical protein
MRQRLQQCVSVASWSDDQMRFRLARKLDSELPGVEALVVDDTGFAKKGRHSVGVQRQYSRPSHRFQSVSRSEFRCSSGDAERSRGTEAAA